MEHTKGPWEISGLLTEIDKRYIIAKIASVRVDVCQVGFTSVITKEERDANARRIVACVNACEGLTNKALEGGAIKELAKTLKIDFEERRK